MTHLKSLVTAIAASLFSATILSVLVSLPITMIFGPAVLIVYASLFRNGTLTVVTIFCGALLVLEFFAYDRFVLRPLRRSSRPGSTYVKRWLTAVATIYCQVVLSLFCSGPLRIVFLGRDPFKFVSKIEWKIRTLDAQIHKTRPPVYRVGKTGRTITIPLRDGVETTATLYSPQTKESMDDDTPRPVILIRTPYSREGMQTWGVRFAERGYHLVAQDTRGRFGSTGDFFPMQNEATDGAATVEWLEKQSWCNGDVGMTGISYLGMASWAAMREEVPALKAVAPILAATDLYHVSFGRGSKAVHVELLFRWSYLVIHLMNKPYGMLEAIPNFFLGSGQALRRAYMHAPLKEADTEYLCPNLLEPLEFFQGGLSNPNGDEKFWNDNRKLVDLTKMDPQKLPPVLLFAGWYDIFSSEQLHDFEALCRISDECRIVVGPYTHWHILSMKPKLFRSLFDFFDLHLLKDPVAKTLAKVEVFSMGHDMGWQQMASWPPSKAFMKKFVLTQEDGTNNNLIIEAEKSSSALDDEKKVSYAYDPADPTPQIGGSTFNPTNCGRFSQNEVESRADVLVFTSRPLEQPLMIAGQIKVRLAVESNVEGTDYVARACHVTSNGVSQNLSDGIIRRFDLKPGERNTIEINLSPVMNQLSAGDRFRIQICSSAYPKYGRHMNTRESFHLEVEDNALLSKQLLFLGGEEGCHILVPVLSL